MDKKQKRDLQEKTEAEYKRITRSLTSINRNDDIAKIQTLLTEHIQKSSELYPIIKKRLTGSAADARHLRTMIHLSNDTAKRINATSRPFELKKVIMSLKNESGNKIYEFVAKEHVLECLRIPPTFEFFYGAIKREGLIIKERRKRAKVEVVTTKATTATEKNISTDVEQDSTPKEVEAIYKRIKNLTDTNPNGVQFFQTIIDPTSFTQTVENIFHTSFLVKEGKIGVKTNHSNKPVLTHEDDQCRTQDRTRPPKQSILSFTMADYNRWKSSRPL